MNPAPSSSSEKWRILCIDDEPDILDILRTTLELKHEVVTARDGVEGVGMLDLCEADFVICDVRMPQMDGFQTVEAIRHHPKPAPRWPNGGSPRDATCTSPSPSTRCAFCRTLTTFCRNAA